MKPTKTTITERRWALVFKSASLRRLGLDQAFVAQANQRIVLFDTLDAGRSWLRNRPNFMRACYRITPVEVQIRLIAQESKK